ncbi:hypothetical protein AB0M29_38205 [Streptomyces sp. NPDC051976]|uniref:hypothetical protein n=1 Tax=Streptomyces sp. NPDC051976 TaxID=3154947 RepID=UPI0034249B54
MAVMSEVDPQPGWLTRLAHRVMGEPQRSAPDGYSVPGNDWPAVELHMSVDEVDQALKAIDDRTVARAQEELIKDQSASGGSGNT